MEATLIFRVASFIPLAESVEDDVFACTTGNPKAADESNMKEFILLVLLGLHKTKQK